MGKGTENFNRPEKFGWFNLDYGSRFRLLRAKTISERRISK